MTTLLVMTTGQSDVQLVANGVRQELEPRMSGVLHDEIEHRGYRLADVPIRKHRERKEVLPEGDLTLCTPKLDAVLRFFDGNSLPAAALIFDTRRKLGSDPRFAGAVLERRLNERGVQAASRHALLAGEERLEDSNEPLDAVVRREVSQGVVQVLAPKFDEVKPDKVVVAATGGFPSANAVIEELVRLHAVGRASVEVLKVPDGASSTQEDRAVPERLHPAAGFRARWRALKLIEGGNLLGAWGAVSHLAVEPGQEWTKNIDWLRCFAASLPIPGDCDMSVLKHPRMAVRAALRVQLALRAGDIPRAIHGTVSFFEAALWDWLRERDFTGEDGARGDLATGFTFDVKLTGEPTKRFWKRDSVWRINDFRNGVDAWLSVLRKPWLSAFWGALTDGVRDLRNDVAHNEPTPELMDAARAQMQQAQLWSGGDTFLTQRLVQGVLRELGETEPEKLLERLMADVRRRLVSLSYPSTLESALPTGEESHRGD